MESFKNKSVRYMLALTPLVRCGGAGNPCNYKDFLETAARLFNYLVILAVPLAVLGIAVGGFMIMTGGSGEGLNKGKDAIKYSIIGLIVAAAAWLIINLVITGLGAKGFSNPLG